MGTIKKTAQEAAKKLKNELGLTYPIITKDNTYWVYKELKNTQIDEKTKKLTKEIAIENNLDFRINIAGNQKVEKQLMNMFPKDNEEIMAQLFIGFRKKTTDSKKREQDINSPYLDAIKKFETHKKTWLYSKLRFIFYKKIF